LLKDRDLFQDYPSAVIYYYPCYLKEPPVNWHETLNIPVSYHVGLPSKGELVELPKRACVVIDDSFDEAIQSSAIDHLFRVISGKRNICVIIMTQNNFTKGRYGRDIRNSCNFSVLFRNCCDTSINENVARMAGLRKAYSAASRDQDGTKYPYMFLDQSQQGQLSPFRLYTSLFGDYKIVWSFDGMKGYVIGAPDFESVFNAICDKKSFTAKQYENKRSENRPKKRDDQRSKTKSPKRETTNEESYYYSSESESEYPKNPTFYGKESQQKIRYPHSESTDECESESDNTDRERDCSPAPRKPTFKRSSSSEKEHGNKKARRLVFSD